MLMDPSAATAASRTALRGAESKGMTEANKDLAVYELGLSSTF